MNVDLPRLSFLAKRTLALVTKVLGMLFLGGVLVRFGHLTRRNHPVLELIEEISKRLYVHPPMWMIPKLSRAGLLSNLGENRRSVPLETQLLVPHDMTPVFAVPAASKPHVRDAEDAERTLLLNDQELTRIIMQMFALVTLGQFSNQMIDKLQELVKAHVLRVLELVKAHVLRVVQSRLHRTCFKDYEKDP